VIFLKFVLLNLSFPAIAYSHAAVLSLPYEPSLLSICSSNRHAGSEEMALIQLFIPSEIARSAVSSLGEAGCVQFLDVPLSLM
jgi:hypothetical protein